MSYVCKAKCINKIKLYIMSLKNYITIKFGYEFGSKHASLSLSLSLCPFCPAKTKYCQSIASPITIITTILNYICHFVKKILMLILIIKKSKQLQNVQHLKLVHAYSSRALMQITFLHTRIVCSIIYFLYRVCAMSCIHCLVMDYI